MPTLIGNAPGLEVKNTSVDYDSMTDEEKLEYLRDKMGRDMPNIHKLSDTEKADYQRLKKLEKPGWAKAKESEAGIQSKIENSKRAADIMSAGNNGSTPIENNADLANQTPAGEASAEGILPGGDGWVNQTGSDSGSGSGDGSMSVDEAMEIANKWAAEGGWYANVMANGSEEDKAKAKMALNVINNSKKAPTKPPKPDDNSNGGDTDNPKDEKAKQESKYKLRSIMDAYNEGILDKETRDYLIMDTLSKFVRNMGKDIGNIAAAYTGGTINNEREESIWAKRNEEMAKKAINAEGNKLRNEDNYDLSYQSQKLDLAKKRIQMVPAQNFQKAAEKMRKDGNESGAALMDLIAAASTQSQDPEEYIATLYATDPNVQNLVNNSMGALSNVAGSLGDLTGMVKDFIKELMDKYGNNSGNNSANKSTGRRIADAAFGGNPLYNVVTNYMDK